MKLGKNGGKPEDGNGSLDNFIRHAIGKEPVLSFSGPGDSPVQWIQLLHALDKQDLPGWSLLSPPRVQMQKCDKCTREFFSPINYRRHIRVHRRPLKMDKDFCKNREFLGAFWDKRSLDEATEIVSFKNVMLEEVPGSSIITALASFIHRPGFSPLPQVYVKAGTALLDVIQARPSRFPISSQELFSILDDASETTFLCAGTAGSMQKFVFDGEAGKIGLEMKNLVACISFLVEQKLVKAWIVDKDAESLRCQKLLVEEEEAAQKRQAVLLERRRLKRLRQKAKEKIGRDEADFKEASPDSMEGIPSSLGTSSSLAVTNSHLYFPETSSDPAQLFLESVRLLNTSEEVVTGCYFGFNESDTDMASGNSDSTNCQAVDCQMHQDSDQQHLIIAQQPVSRSQHAAPNGFHLGQLLPVSRLGSVQKHGIQRDQRAASLANNHKIWSPKTKLSNEGEVLNARVQRELRDQPDQNESCKVLIGSIPVTLGDCSRPCQGAILGAPLDQCITDHQAPKTFRPELKLWRPVGRHEAGNSISVQNDKREAEVYMSSSKVADQPLNIESYLPCGGTDDCGVCGMLDSLTVLGGADQRGHKFCSQVAEAFLTQRWKEAIAADHVKLVLSLVTEPLGCPKSQMMLM